MKKSLSIILSIIMIFSIFALDGVMAAETPTFGEFGDFWWSYSDYDNSLNITAKDSNVGAYMDNFSYSNGSYNRPWEAFADEIKMIIVHSALSIGDYAFADCKSLRSTIFFGDNLEIIGQGAFQSCVSLKRFDVPRTVVAIGPSAFEGCTNIDLVTMDRYVTYIGNNAFEGCPIEYTLYSGTPDQEKLIYFEDTTESLKNVLHANVKYDVSVQVGEYEVLTAVSLEPFTFKAKNSNVATILQTEYDTVTEGGVDYYIGAAAVSGVSDGVTSIYAIDNNKEVIGAFSAIVGECAISHNFTKRYNATEATCYRGALIVSECGKCSHKRVDFSDTEPHSFVYETVSEVDCETMGIEKGVCSGCGLEREITTPAKGHPYVYTTLKEATCQSPGLEMGECRDCGKKVEYEIPQLDHNWTDWVVTLAPTEETEGERERQCTMCEEKQMEIVPPLSTLMGDVNGDGKVSAIDARWALQCAAKNRELDEHYFKLADINGDGEVTAIDARKILQIAAGR